MENSTSEKMIKNVPDQGKGILSVCFTNPPTVSSYGIWEHFINPNIYPVVRPIDLLPTLELQVFLIFFITYASHFILKRFHLPLFISQVIAGFILGPTIRGLKYKALQQSLFPIMSQEVIGTLTTFGYALFLFITGVKTDLSRIKKAGKLPIAIGVLSLVLPSVFGQGVMTLSKRFIGKEKNLKEKKIMLQFLIVSQSMTSFAVVACLLDQLNIINSVIGRLGLSAALVNDTISLVIQCAATFNFIYNREGQDKFLKDIIACSFFLVAIIFVIRPCMLWIVNNTPAGRPVNEEYIYAIIVLVFGCSLMSHFFGLTVVFGPYILGLAVPTGLPLGSSLAKRIECYIYGLLLPLFITSTILRVDLAYLESSRNMLWMDAILLVLTFFTKIATCLAPSLYCKMHFKDALALALTICTKGVLELAMYSFLHDIEVLNDQTFTVLVLNASTLATFVPILVNYLHDHSRKYSCYHKRNIINLKQNEELRILTCIHTEANILGMMNLLDVACPTKENQVSVYALHLIELTGGSFPIFVSYKLGTKNIISSINYSENVIFALMQYQKRNHGAVSVEAFTAISPPKLMHEDVCTLALDKLISFIVLSFHRRYAFSGEIESEDNFVRALNHIILDRAPCSVAILIDRSHLRHPSTLYRVGVIFLGGNDDREALMFAKRVVNDTKSFSLTVIRFTTGDKDQNFTEWEDILDNEMLKDVRYKTNGIKNAEYREHITMDGPELTRILRTVVNEFDLIVVGRRKGLKSPQIENLETWSEFLELGVIGDMLASSNFNCEASVLVLQQRHVMI